jgi:membrane-associated phospholipid phosphatase
MIYSHKPFAVTSWRTIAACGVIGDYGRILESGSIAKIGKSMHRLRWGVLIGTFALLVFGVGCWQVSTPDSAVWQFDRRCAHTMKEHAAEHPACLDFFRDVTDAGGVPVMTALAVVGALLLWLCDQRQLAAMWLLAAALGCAVNQTSKAIVARQRPGEQLRDAAVTERNQSYPSGHAMGSLIGYGSLGYVGVILLRRRWARALLVALLVGLVTLIGLSRIYLRAHWCSDVIGGFALGTSYMAACISLAQWRRA